MAAFNPRQTNSSGATSRSRQAWWTLTVLLTVAGLCQAERPTTNSAGRAAAPAEKKPEPAHQHQREGTLLTDVSGVFKVSGDGAIFYPAEGGPHYSGLENLNLERVSTMVRENPESLVWSVSGVLTEYRGANYLLISRAILKSKLKPAGPPARQTFEAAQELSRPRAK